MLQVMATVTIIGDDSAMAIAAMSNSKLPELFPEAIVAIIADGYLTV